MRVEHYIVELLYRHNCIVMPEFGAFLANSRPAQTNVTANWIAPPIKTLTFNQQLSKNDGLLVSYIANSKNLAYDDILNEVLECSNAWKKHLDKGEKLVLFGIGSLWMSKENRILFAPEDSTNYLPSSFGLSTISAIPIKREAIKEEVETLEEKIPLIITHEKRESTRFRPWLKYAAVVLLLVSLGASSYLGYNRFENSQELVELDARNKIEQTIQQATFFDGAPVELPAFNVSVKKKEKYIGPKHYVVAGAFRIKENADKKIAQLKDQGYDAEYIGANRFKLHQVAFAGFTDKYEALRYLKNIKRTVSSDAWMLSKK